MILSTLLPPVCAGCGKLGLRVCHACAWSLEVRVTREWCLSCGGSAASCCRHTFRALSLWRHTGTIARIIHKIKYADSPMLIVELISYVTPQQLIHLHFSPDTVIAPIPLHIKKEGERGYNQSQLLADVLSVLTKTPQANLLRRTRYTNSQTTLKTAKERHHNVLGAFEITDKGMSTIRGRRVILVDDVITTGSTMREAANAIRYGDPRQIVGFSLTHE